MSSFPGNKQIYEYHAVDNFEIRVENKNSGCWSSSSVKLIQLCCIGILIPILWILVPVYARLFLYNSTALSLASTDMHVLDTGFSTFWCQSQQFQSNISFDAYLMETTPTTTHHAERLSQNHQFELDDDLKEYWTFYLLKGSQITIRSCSKYLGVTASLMKGTIDSLKSLRCLKDDSGEPDSIEIVASKTQPSPPAAEQEIPLMNKNRTKLDALEFDNNMDEDGAFEEVDDEQKSNTKSHPIEKTNDVSKSSSEEDLLKCSSNLISHPVIPRKECSNSTDFKHNTIKYTINQDGYYTIIFSNTFEHEEAKNQVFTQFDILKSVYNLTNHEASCLNASECSFPLRFASSEKIIIRLTSTDEENSNYFSNFSIETKCVPRTPIYLTFGLTLPLVLILCAFL